MTKIAIGTVQFGQKYGITNKLGQVGKLEVKKILELAREKKIDLLDTAITYGNSEKVLGEIGVSNFSIVTKLPDCPINSLNLSLWVKNHIKESLSRLGINSLYGLLVHRPENLFGSLGVKLRDVLYELKSDGLIKKIGVSIYNPNDLFEITKNIKLDIVQAPINLIDQRLQTSGWLSRLHDNGVEIHSRSSFLQGLLLLPRKKIPTKFERWSFIWDRWEEKKKNCSKSALQLCLDYPMSLPEINKIIVGVDNLEQFHSIFLASKSIIKSNDDHSFISSNDNLLINPFNWNKL